MIFFEARLSYYTTTFLISSSISCNVDKNKVMTFLSMDLQRSDIKHQTKVYGKSFHKGMVTLEEFVSLRSRPNI